nr:ABC transporter transmembrane domain-containing protein [Shewanella glacialipiscicola]
MGHFECGSVTLFHPYCQTHHLQDSSKLIKRLGRIAISEYETRGSAGIASHFVTDIEVIDNFIGNTISRFIVATLSIIGTAVILLFLHWQLALLILFMNPLVIYFTMVVGKHVKELKGKKILLLKSSNKA